MQKESDSFHVKLLTDP